MTTEDDAQLRQLLRMNQELPQPMSDLLKRVSKRFSKPRVLKAGELPQASRDKFHRRLKGLKRTKKDYSITPNIPQIEQ